MKNFAIIVAILFLFTGCSARGVKFQDTQFAVQQAPANKARFIFLRQSQSLYRLRSAPIEIDGVRVGSLKNAGFFVVDDIVPGEREISTDVWDDLGRFTIKITAEAGQTYYILGGPRKDHFTSIFPAQLFLGLPGVLVASAVDGQSPFQLQRIDQDRAERLLLRLRLSE